MRTNLPLFGLSHNEALSAALCHGPRIISSTRNKATRFVFARARYYYLIHSEETGTKPPARIIIANPGVSSLRSGRFSPPRRGSAADDGDHYFRISRLEIDLPIAILNRIDLASV